MRARAMLAIISWPLSPQADAGAGSTTMHAASGIERIRIWQSCGLWLPIVGRDPWTTYQFGVKPAFQKFLRDAVARPSFSFGGAQEAQLAHQGLRRMQPAVRVAEKMDP